MKAFITLPIAIGIITCSMVAFGQNDSTLTVKPNPLQLEQLQQMEQQMQAQNEAYQKAIELITGIRGKDIETIEFKEGLFVVKKKKEKAIK
jgi:hypothetical protein